MTVSTINSVAEFETNGATTSFPFYFKFLENKDLVVTFINPDGVGIPLTLGTHYTVSGAGNEKGGSITTTAVLDGPGKLFVSRVMSVYQQTSLRNQGKFLAGTHEDVFDRLTMLIQQTDAIFSRAIRSTDYETLPQLPPAAVRAKKVMGFDSAGNPLTSNLTLEQLEQQPVLALASAAEAKVFADEASESAERSGELADRSGEFAVAAEDAATLSLSAASIASAISKPFTNIADGIAATAGSGSANRFFSVPVAGDPMALAILYRNDTGSATEIGRSPSSMALQAFILTFPSIAPIGYVWSSFDKFYRAAIGIKDDGTFAAALSELTRVIVGELKVGGATLSGVPLPGFRLVIDDALRRAAVGVKDDGTFAAKAVETSSLKVQTINGQPYTSGSLSRCGGVYSHQVNFINNAGQSLGEGSTPATALTTTQEYDNVGFPAHSTSPTTFVPLTVANTQVSSRGESPMYGTLGHIKELIAEENGISYTSNDYQLSACNNAYSGYSILTLNKGTAPYAASLSQVQAAFDIATAAGKTMSFQATTWTQGEANGAMSKDEYKGHMKQLALDYNTDGKSITGQPNDIKFICYQCATANRNIAVAQLEASNESGLIFMACPMYQFDYGDLQHINAQSSKWLGGYYGLALKRLIVDKVDWQPLQPMGHAINGNTIDLIFNKTGLVLDTTLIPAQADHGFQVLNAATGAIAISSIAVIAPNRVRFTLATAPAPGWFIRYGFNSAVDKGPFVGGCGNLRDSQGDTIVYAAINKPMHNWCVIFNYSI